MTESYAGREILILGGAGFIGSNLALACMRRGARVTVVDAFLPDSGADVLNLAGVLEGSALRRGRLQDLHDLGTLLARADLVIDAMALTAHHIGLEDPARDLDANLASHVSLIQTLRHCTGKRVLYLGSRGQYGRAREPINEEMPQVPIDTQGVHKLAAESLFRIYAPRYGFHAVSLRLPNCFGENQKTTGRDLGLVASFIRDLSAGETVTILGDERRSKSLLYVQDLVDVVLRLGAEEFRGFEAYNVAGIDVALGDLVDRLVRLVGKGGYEVTPFPDDVRRMDTGGGRLDDHKLRTRLGALGRTPLDTALENTVRYFQARLTP